ncbi:MAG: T9SS type A sorting domain-containing protein [Bacteroidetes bacterium]|nr:T9SS type A sorting domain-containing protein [Bacteroidota bacterium]
MSSEWLGVLISNVSQLAPDDTLGLLETGGWCVGSKIMGDTLWACQEGYGIVAYNRDSLLSVNGTMTDSKLMHIFTQFVSDFEIIDDTLLILSTMVQYDLNPWFAGNNPDSVANMNQAWIVSVNRIETDEGTRIIAGYDNPVGQPRLLLLYDPYDSQNGFPIIAHDTVANSVMSVLVSHDTLFCGKMIGDAYYLAMYRITNDSFVLIDTVAAPGEILSLSTENGIIAAACGQMWFAWYSVNGNTLTQLGTMFDWFINAQAVYLRNNYIYVADKFYGLKIYDISVPTQAVPVAQCRGTGGFSNVFGSDGVVVGDDGLIYLSDFNAGVIVIEAFDTILSKTPEVRLHEQADLSVYPNPAGSTVSVTFSPGRKGSAEICVYDIRGGKVMVIPEKQYGKEEQTVAIDVSELPEGIYVISLSSEGVARSKVVEVVR